MPQIWLRPFIGRTMVEDRAGVKASGGSKRAQKPCEWVPPCPAAHRSRRKKPKGSDDLG
jgi:hypothetical protein